MNIVIFKMIIMLLSDHLSPEQLDHSQWPSVFRYGNYYSNKSSKSSSLTDRALTLDIGIINCKNSIF